MAGTAVLGRLNWARATVAAVTEETPRVRTLVLDIDGWTGHRAGIRSLFKLTASPGNADYAHPLLTNC